MITSLERKLAKYQRNLSTQWRRKGRQRIAVKERQKKARSDVLSRSSSSTSSSDSSDWKKSAQVRCCRKIEALVFLLANLMVVRQGMFFNYEKRRHARKCVIWPILGTSFSANRLLLLNVVVSSTTRCQNKAPEHFVCILLQCFRRMDIAWYCRSVAWMVRGWS